MPRRAPTFLAALMLPLAAGLLLAAWPSTAQAQERRPSHCISLVENVPGIAAIRKASFADPTPDWTLRLRYIGHAMFLLTTPGGTTAVTDYSGFLGTADFAPDVATMNRAHSTHWTANPDPRIPHVLPGWNPDGGPAGHHLEVGDLLVRSVSTDIRSFAQGLGEDGNAIFVFEAAGLCVGHLGHLHHEPTEAQYAALGRLDVVMAPVDGGYTMAVDAMIRVLERLRASVVVPMHWFGRTTLERFLADVSGTFAIERREEPTLEVSLRTLPERPTVIVLEPAWLSRDE